MRIPTHLWRIPILPWIGNAIAAAICGNLASLAAVGDKSWSWPFVMGFAILGGWATWYWWTRVPPQ